ncbi:AGAP013254-PA-like protein [Anopheles sinensis]|uniref:AGAP013254-PA-like protein n=1 Tax=Anopheles sinensis TaxID=74873 RepID=A0A084WT82_ANOSI|nr:AGAP013254-PA-like protein [Anopheles sinensis]
MCQRLVCGMPQQKSATVRVVGGAEVTPSNKYPWLALVQYYGRNVGTGTLVNDRVVLTSATIVSSTIIFKQIKVVFGAFDASSDMETTRKEFTVTKAKVHPQYSADNPMRNNIGFLQLAVPVTITDSFMPICLPSNVDTFANTNGTLAGWGARRLDEDPWKTLQEAQIPLYSYDECHLAYPNSTEDNICGGVFDPAPKDQHRTSCNRQVPQFTPPPPKEHGPTTPAAIGLFIVPFPQSVADGSIVDVNPNFIAALQSGGSPFSAIVQSDTGEGGFPPNTNWTLPQHVALISSFINRTQGNILKPGAQQQSNDITNTQSSATKDPVVLHAPVAYKPGTANIVAQLLANAPGFNNSFTMITNLAEGKPAAGASVGPQSDPLQELIDSPQSAVVNATSAAQGVIGQWGSNVQNGIGNFFGLSSNRPSNDQTASGSQNAPLNPVQSFIEGSQASLSNATAVAQGIAGQLGSNVQNGVSNVFGINLNRPSNDEPVTDTTQSTSSGTETTTSTTQSLSTESVATDSSTASASVTTAPTTASSSPGFSNPFSNLFNVSQLSLLNNSNLVQTLTSQKHDQRGASLKDNPGSGFLPNSNWSLPQNLDVISSFINQSGIVKPSSGLQLGASNNGLTIVSNDPVVLQAPVAYKPEKPNLLGQLLVHAPGFNNSFTSISNLVQPKPEAPAAMVLKDPIPDPVQALISSSQSAVSNTTGAVQGTVGQWGSNVQNGVSNLFGVNVNRPSNDEPVTDTTQATSAVPDTTTSAAQTASATDSSTASATDTTTSAAQTSSATDSTTASASVTAAPVATTTISGIFNPLLVLGGSSKPSLLNATQALIAPLASSGLIFFQNPNRPNATENVKADTPLADVPAPTPPTCAGCTPGQCSTSTLRNLRIIGGSDVTSTTNFPWLALIKYSMTPVGQGSLINDRAILTTATLVANMPDLTMIAVVLGITSLSATGTTDLDVSNTYVHPGYTSFNLFRDNIGILTLSTPLTTSFVPVCLPAASDVYYPIPKATVVGWGSKTTLGGPLSDILQAAELQMFATTACQLPYGKVITNKNLCAGQVRSPATRIGTCTGDGGAPLMSKPVTGWKLIGISIEIPNTGCGVYSQPSVFTNVEAYINWINTYGPGCSCPQSSPY